MALFQLKIILAITCVIAFFYPGLTPTSLFPDAARAAGYEFPELIEKLIHLALDGK